MKYVPQGHKSTGGGGSTRPQEGIVSVANIPKTAKNLKDYKPKSNTTKAQFDRMTYKEKVALHRDFPEEYERLKNERN